MSASPIVPSVAAAQPGQAASARLSAEGLGGFEAVLAAFFGAAQPTSPPAKGLAARGSAEEEVLGETPTDPLAGVVQGEAPLLAGLVAANAATALQTAGGRAGGLQGGQPPLTPPGLAHAPGLPIAGAAPDAGQDAAGGAGPADPQGQAPSLPAPGLAKAAVPPPVAASLPATPPASAASAPGAEFADAAPVPPQSADAEQAAPGPTPGKSQPASSAPANATSTPAAAALAAAQPPAAPPPAPAAVSALKDAAALEASPAAAGAETPEQAAGLTPAPPAAKPQAEASPARTRGGRSAEHRQDGANASPTGLAARQSGQPGVIATGALPPASLADAGAIVDPAGAAGPADLALEVPEPPEPVAQAAPAGDLEEAEAPARAAAAPARGAPETVANLAAQILKKLDARTSRFDIELTPAGLGRVDVRVEIGANGRLTAAMSFDNPQAAAELRGRAGELQRALEQAGFDVSGGLSFDGGGEHGGSGHGFAGHDQGGAAPWTGRAFQAALVRAGEADEAALNGQLDLQRRIRSGVDVRI